MSREWQASTDTTFGITVALTILGGVGAAHMVAGVGGELAGWGVAIAVVAGIAAIIAMHLSP